MNRRIYNFCYGICAVLIFFSACQNNTAKTISGLVHQFDLQDITKNSKLDSKWINSNEFGEKVLSIFTDEGNNELILTSDSENIDWADAKYLICDVWHDNPFCLLMHLQFFRKTGNNSDVTRQGAETVKQEVGPHISCNIGILPHLKTKMVFPLSHLDGQIVYLERQSRQMKGTVSGRRMDPEDIGKVSIRILPDKSSDFLSKVEIASVYLATELPVPYEKPAEAVVDSFGQWTAREWRGKVHNFNELKASAGLMKNWRINTVANWSDSEMAHSQRKSYVINMNNFPTTRMMLYRDFPDVFDPAYNESAQRFAKQLELLKNDPYLIGYFLQNEPKWAFGDNNLAFEMMATAVPSFTKKEMVRWLGKKYGNIDAFNKAWKLNLADLSNLETLAIKDKPSEVAWNDCTEFSGMMVDHYVQIICCAVKKVDPNHLNLGMRYAWISSELCYRAGSWFDVFSINGYSNPEPPNTEEITRRRGKPVIIGEWHFGCAIEGGLPASGIQGTENQTARGEAYRYYFEHGVVRPEIIGIHWFQWNDQPVLGRFDGENYNIGFLDIAMQPYTELTEQAKIAHERMYRLATGVEQPYNKQIRKVPQIYY